MKNFSDFPSKILDIIFLRCDNKTVERFQTSHNFINGLVAQLGAHHIRIVGVVGSNPIRSIKGAVALTCGSSFHIPNTKRRASKSPAFVV